jgi:hypothetical protein
MRVLSLALQSTLTPALSQREREKSLTPSHHDFSFKDMDHKTPRNTAVPQNHAQDKKRADALRQNLLKRKQQSRARDSETPHKEK